MAACPKCASELPWRRVLKFYFMGNAHIECINCGVRLMVDKSKIKMFDLILIGTVAVLGTLAALMRVGYLLAFLLLAFYLCIGGVLFVRFVRLREIHS